MTQHFQCSSGGAQELRNSQCPALLLYVGQLAIAAQCLLSILLGATAAVLSSSAANLFAKKKASCRLLVLRISQKIYIHIQQNICLCTNWVVKGGFNHTLSGISHHVRPLTTFRNVSSANFSCAARRSQTSTNNKCSMRQAVFDVDK